MHLLLAPFLASIVLVEAREVAIVALVERLVADRFQLALADAVQNVLAGLLRPLQRRGEGDVEFEPARGAVRAALWARDRKPGLYSMRDVLGLSAG